MDKHSLFGQRLSNIHRFPAKQLSAIWTGSGKRDQPPERYRVGLSVACRGIRVMEPQEAITAARAVAEEYHRAFNAADLEASRAILNYPSVRMASGNVRVWHHSDEYEINWDTLRTQEGWHHSTLDDMEVVQAGHDKVHLAATFTRYGSDGKPYARHRAIWIVTLVRGGVCILTDTGESSAGRATHPERAASAAHA